MLQAIKGYYDNGVVVLDEQPYIKQKEPIIIFFLNENIELTKNEKVRKIGGLEGFVNVPNDFNESFDYNATMPKKGGVKLGGLEGKLNIPDDFDEPLDELNQYFNRGI